MLLDDIFANIPDSYTQADKDLIEKAYYFAEKAHEGQKRASGEPYFTHCVAVALILCEMKVQSMVISAALLHDTVEDTPVTCCTIPLKTLRLQRKTSEESSERRS